MLIPLSERANRALDDAARKIAWLLPRRIVMWASVRLIAHATQGVYSNQIVPALTAMDALKRWDGNKGEPVIMRLWLHAK